jgi:hypothetical protein
MGLPTWSSIPAAKHRSRSDCRADAVKAMMGIRLPSGSARRIVSVASNPSITGIWQSISTAS